MARSAVLGLPRMGADRELKFALESHWAGETDAAALDAVVREVRAAGWRAARDAGVDVIPSGEHSRYDHVLDTAHAFGLVPERSSDYFTLARGGADVRPLEMTKWFDTNYHYLVPELRPGMTPALDASHWLEPLAQATELGVRTRPVVLGPWSLLLLAKGLDAPLALLDALVPAYRELLAALAAAGADAVQVDEPCLVGDRTRAELDAFADAWDGLASAGPALTLATYFAGTDAVGALDRVAERELAELHLDLVRAPGQLAPALDRLADRDVRLSLGVVDGRNVWASDHDRALDLVDAAVGRLGTDRVTVAPSCSLLHVPWDVTRERAAQGDGGRAGIPDDVLPWLAFARQKLDEVVRLAAAADADADARDRLLADARDATAMRRGSSRTNDATVRDRVGALAPGDHDRSAPFPQRQEAQRRRLGLPALPTTTIGSFPQTADIRTARRDHREGRLDDAAYEGFLQARVTETIRLQERLGLDVLVHGEPERNDMVEYFGERLEGFAFSAHGWVQSYGSRCVKPPILFGDVSRRDPMTVDWWRHAQAQTERPVKGMLTGPVTILQWSFVRDDQPERETCTQIALAVQDEVADLEAAGCAIIQVDEAALREGLPLQRADQDAYQRWAIDCFRLCAATVRDDTQIHTHMCYSEFNDLMEHIIRLDADVLSIEASRSGMEVLDVFGDGTRYPNEIGPGVYDIHSPRVPDADELERLLAAAEERIGRDALWVNPDCGLKTRRWAEVEPALAALVEAAQRRRAAA